MRSHLLAVNQTELLLLLLLLRAFAAEGFEFLQLLLLSGTALEQQLR